MAQNNLRLIFNNLADISTISVSTTAAASAAASNLKSDYKSIMWRSGTATSAPKANIVVTLPVDTTLAAGMGLGIVLAFTNLTTNATITVKGWTGTAPTVGGTADTPTLTTTGATAVTALTRTSIACNPYQNLGYSFWNATTPFNIMTSAQARVYSRVWVPAVTASTVVRHITLEIVETSAHPTKYIEASRLIIGDYWSPTYNTSYGLGVQTKDTTDNVRTEAGDLVSNVGVDYNVLNFDLKWLDKTDRATLNKILRYNGLKKPIFVSLFPDNSDDWEKEQIYQIYGKLSGISSIVHPVLDMYSSQIEIEEI